MTIGDGDTEETGLHATGRYEALRFLAAGLASAITVDDVARIVAERAAGVVGAIGCDVRVARHDGDSTHVISRHVHESIAPLFNAHPELAVSELISATAPRTVELRWRDGVYTAAVFPLLFEPGRTAVVSLIWRGLPADEEDVAAVAGLCLAGLQRAWATRRMRELGPIMDALLDQASIGLAFIDEDLRYVHVNDRLARTNGRSAAGHRGRTVRQVTPAIADQVEPLLRRVLETGEPTAEIEFSTADVPGVAHQVFVATFLPVSFEGDVVGVAAVVDDVTEHRRQLADLHRRYEFERQVAVRLQRGLTPRDLPRPEGYEVAVRYSAGSDGLRIGGDWYDLVEVASDRLALVIGDVVGHGLDAALAMVRIRHALAGLSHALVDPVEILGRLDSFATDDEDQFVATLVYGMLEPETGLVTMSSAGHVPPLLIRGDGSIERLQTLGAPLGITAADRDAITVGLGPGDTLVLYTDGVIEERGEALEKGMGRLVAVATEPFGSVDELADRIAVMATQRDNADDAAIMVLRRR